MDRCSRLKLLRLHLQLHNQEETNIGNQNSERHIPDPKRLNKTVDLWNRDLVDVASDIGMQKPTARRRIYDFCTLYTKTVVAHLSKQQVS
jgi:hypothetical protein